MEVYLALPSTTKTPTNYFLSSTLQPLGSMTITTRSSPATMPHGSPTWISYWAPTANAKKTRRPKYDEERVVRPIRTKECSNTFEFKHAWVLFYLRQGLLLVPLVGLRSKPEVGLHLIESFREQVLCIRARDGGQDDTVISVLPVRRRGDLVVVCCIGG